MQSISATSVKSPVPPLKSDLSNYADWSDVIESYLRSRECWGAVNPDDEEVKQMADLLLVAAAEDK